MLIRNQRHKFILYETFRPQLFDLKNDPDELVDLGEDEATQNLRLELTLELFRWLRQRRNRTEMPTERLFKMGPGVDERLGILIGCW